MNFRLLLILFVFAVIIVTCTKEQIPLPIAAPPPPPPSLSYCDSMKSISRISYKCVVDSIFLTYCALSNCHVANAIPPDLTKLTAIVADTAKIRNQMVTNKYMPPNYATRFPQDSLRDKVGKWISRGANNN